MPIKFCSILLLLFSFLPHANAANRVALIIGNSNYHFSPLTNPVNDAQDMAKTLENMGFDVSMHTDIGRKEMRLALREFGEKLKNHHVGLFYFAGHGIQMKGKNYLIPVDANVVSADEVEDEGIAADAVLRKMETAGNDVNIVILDACRNNPFASSFRSADNGLARMEGPVGSFIAYATAPGSIASDGDGRNGLYTHYLLQALQQPNLTIEQTFKMVRNGVRAQTDGQQIPWESSSLTGEFSFRLENNNAELANQATSASTPPPPINQFGHLQVVTNVAHANVAINNQPRGLVDNQGVLNISNVSSKQVEVIISAEGYQQQRQKVQLRPGQWKTINVHLKSLSTPAVLVNPEEQQAALARSCFTNKRVLLRNLLTIKAANKEKKTKSHPAELSAIITKALNEYGITVIDANDVIAKHARKKDRQKQISAFIKTAKKYDTDYVLAVNADVSETPITAIKTTMKSMQGEISLRVYDIDSGQVLASETRSFTKAGIQLRPIIKNVMLKEVDSVIEQLLLESCIQAKKVPKPSLMQKAKNMLNF